MKARVQGERQLGKKSRYREHPGYLFVRARSAHGTMPSAPVGIELRIDAVGKGLLREALFPIGCRPVHG